MAEIITVKKGKKPSRIIYEALPGYRKLIQIDDLRPDAVTKYCPLSSDEVCAEPSDVIIAWDGANAGTSSFGLSGVLGSTLAALRPIRSDVDTGYLGHFVRSKTTFLREACKGATVPHIDGRVLGSLDVPLPPLAEQRRIADILDRAIALRSARIHAMVELDTLRQALFMDMFGNPITNAKGWPVAAMRDLATVERGRFTPRPRNDPRYYTGMYPFIQTGDISSSGGRVNSWTQTLNERGVAVSRSFPPGTVVIAIVGATLGMTAILDIEVYCPDSIVGIQPTPGLVTAEYLDQILRFWRPIFVAQAPATARANINLQTLRPLIIPAPPIALQLDYSRRLTATEKLRVTQERSVAQLDVLLDAYKTERSEVSCEQLQLPRQRMARHPGGC